MKTLVSLRFRIPLFLLGLASGFDLYARPLPPGGEDLLEWEGLRALQLRGDAAAVEFGPLESGGWKASTDRDLAQPWDAELVARLGEPLPAGTVGLLQFEARMRSTSQESGEGYLWAVVQEDGAPWLKSLERLLSVGGEWRTYSLPFVAREDAPPAMLSLGLGFRRQTLELRNLILLRFPANTSLEALPETRFSYAGREPEAAWRKEALARIERLRRSDVTLRIIDARGNPVPGVELELKQERSEFDFGSVFRMQDLLAEDEDGVRYRAMAKQLFNSGGPESDLKWPGWAGDWAPGTHREQTLEGLRWLKREGFRTRGHVLVWPGWTHLPAFLEELHASGAPPEAVAEAVLDHIADVVTATKPYLEEWDVANELRTNRDLLELLGEDVPVAWFAAAKALHPEARLAYNDYENHDPARDPKDLEQFLSIAGSLLEQGAPLDVLGIQGHISGNPTPPEQLLRAFDRCAALGLPLRITEFDVNTEDEALQGDYTRDFLIAAYSHPAVLGVQNWGFWAGSHYLPRAALYREDWSEKPNGRAWRELVTETWRTRAEGETDASGSFTFRGYHGDYVVTFETADGPVTRAFSLPSGGGTEQTIALNVEGRVGASPTWHARATTPDPRSISYEWMSLGRWYAMHAEDVKAAGRGEGRLLFWGDSITEGWEGAGRPLWETHFAPRGALNFGIGGDMTQNLLWRMDHGALGELSAREIVLLIGTNNFGFTDESPATVAAGVKAVVTRLRSAYPDARLLLMAVFPRDASPDSPSRERIAALNEHLAPLGDLASVTWMDIGDRFMLSDGSLDPNLMPDYLHLSEAGYAIWAEAILEWLGDEPSLREAD